MGCVFGVILVVLLLLIYWMGREEVGMRRGEVDGDDGGVDRCLGDGVFDTQ